MQTYQKFGMFFISIVAREGGATAPPHWPEEKEKKEKKTRF